MTADRMPNKKSADGFEYLVARCKLEREGHATLCSALNAHNSEAPWEWVRVVAVAEAGVSRGSIVPVRPDPRRK